MTKTTCHISISLDGFVAGPNQDLDNPLGVGGMRLHTWHFHEPLHEADTPAVQDLLNQRGAYVMGRNMFGPIRGDWPDEEWQGWWGDDPPFHCPVYVLTHHPRDPFELEGGKVMPATRNRERVAKATHTRLRIRFEPEKSKQPVRR